MFLCIDHWGRLSYLSLLFSGTLYSDGYIFPLLGLLFLFNQLFVKLPQTNILPFCVSFSWGYFWSPPPVQCCEPLPIVLQFSSVTQSCLTFCNPMNCSTPGFPIHHQLLEPTHTHVHWVGDAIQPSHPLSSPSPALNLSQHQGLFKWISSLHQVAKVLEFQL